MALPQHQSISWWFQLIAISCKLDGHSMASTAFSTPCLLRCFTRTYKKVVMHFSYKKISSIILLHMEFQPLFLFLTLAKLGPLPCTGCLGLWRRLYIPTEDRLCRNVNTDLGCRTDKCQVDWEMRIQGVWIWGQLLISCANLINLCNFLKLHLFNGNNNILIVWEFSVMVWEEMGLALSRYPVKAHLLLS